MQVGHADGIACRTMEMFEALGFSERVLREAYWMNETTFWKPGDAGQPALSVGPHPGTQDVAIGAMPAILRPRKGKFGLVDYEKVFSSDAKAGDIFNVRAVDRTKGYVFIVRSDQNVADLLPIDAHAELSASFAACMT